MDSHATHLIKDKLWFNEQLEKAIEYGNKINSIQIKDDRELKEIEDKFSSWDDYNIELFKQSFNEQLNEYRDDYEKCNQMFGFEYIMKGGDINSFSFRLKKLNSNLKEKTANIEQLKAKLDLIPEIKMHEKNLETPRKSEKGQNKKIFISHSTNDKKIANLFQDIIIDHALTIKPSEIFNSSSPGMKVKIGDDWRIVIKENLTSSDLIFIIITPNYL
jgi:hypothetical protein